MVVKEEVDCRTHAVFVARTGRGVGNEAGTIGREKLVPSLRQLNGTLKYCLLLMPLLQTSCAVLGLSTQVFTQVIINCAFPIFWGAYPETWGLICRTAQHSQLQSK